MQTFLTLQPQDTRDYTFGTDSSDNTSRSYSWNVEIIPKVKDLRKFTGAIEHQAHYGACSGNSICSALECMLAKENAFVDLSRLFVYYNARRAVVNSPEEVSDKGASLQVAIAECTKYGVAAENIWNYSQNINQTPNQESYTDAVSRKINRYERLGNGVDLLSDILIAITNNIPVVFGTHLTKPFQTLVGQIDQHTTKYNPGKIITTNSDYIGAHGMVIVGFNLNKKEFIVENSWGSSWGDQGYCALSFDNVLQNGFDFFAIREFANITTVLNPQYIKGYTGEIVIEPDDILPVPTTPKQSKNPISTLISVIAIAAIAFAAYSLIMGK